MSIASSALKIICISLASFLFGAAVFFGYTVGLSAMLLSPLLAVFGWFYLAPVVLFVAVLWVTYNPDRKAIWYRALAVALCMVVGGGFMAICGVGSSDSDWRLGYSLAGALAGGVASASVSLLKKKALGP
jgi:hypothetical protein